MTFVPSKRIEQLTSFSLLRINHPFFLPNTGTILASATAQLSVDVAGFYIAAQPQQEPLYVAATGDAANVSVELKLGPAVDPASIVASGANCTLTDNGTVAPSDDSVQGGAAAAPRVVVFTCAGIVAGAAPLNATFSATVPVAAGGSTAAALLPLNCSAAAVAPLEVRARNYALSVAAPPTQYVCAANGTAGVTLAANYSGEGASGAALIGPLGDAVFDCDTKRFNDTLGTAEIDCVGLGVGVKRLSFSLDNSERVHLFQRMYLQGCLLYRRARARRTTLTLALITMHQKNCLLTGLRAEVDVTVAHPFLEPLPFNGTGASTLGAWSETWQPAADGGAAPMLKLSVPRANKGAATLALVLGGGVDAGGVVLNGTAAPYCVPAGADADVPTELAALVPAPRRALFNCSGLPLGTWSLKFEASKGGEREGAGF